MLALVHDLPTIWHAPTTPHVERKPLGRLLMQDVPLTRRATTMPMAIRWPTHAGPLLALPRPRRAGDARRTAPVVLARLRDLAASQTDRPLALRRTHEGDTAGVGGAVTAAHVQGLRWRSALPRRRPPPPAQPREAGRSAARAAAALRHGDVSTSAAWGLAGQWASLQAAPHHPRWITRTPDRLAVLRTPVRQRPPRHAPA